MNLGDLYCMLDYHCSVFNACLGLIYLYNLFYSILYNHFDRCIRLISYKIHNTNMVSGFEGWVLVLSYQYLNNSYIQGIFKCFKVKVRSMMSKKEEAARK